MQRQTTEAPLFEKVFKAVPDGKLDWKPEPKSRTARELLGHLIGHEQDILELLERGEINHRMQVPFNGVSEAVALLQKAQEASQAKLKAVDDATWDKPGKFLVEGNVIYEMPRRELAWILLFDSVHHRGQLSTYLRPMGSKVPSLYGPSADEAPSH